MSGAAFRRVLSAVVLPAVALAVLVAPTPAQPLRIEADPALMDELARRRAANHRRDCEAQWRGGGKGQARPVDEERAFVEECVRAAAIRCHPRGSDPTCDYTRDRDRRSR